MELLHNLERGEACYGPGVFVFNLPAPGTCKPTSWCAINCYAHRSYLNKKNRQKRYKISLSENFPDLVVDEIKKKKIKLVRLHSTGDFYSEDYVKKWVKIGQNCTDTFFRTSTRRLDLVDIISELNNLPNFVVRESLDPSRKKPFMNLPLEIIEAVPLAENCFKCLLDCNKCGHYCWYYKINISLPLF